MFDMEYIFIENQAKMENIINEWCKEAGVKLPVGYYRSSCGNVIEIYSKEIGYLIGCRGKLVNKYKGIFDEEFSGNYDIKFIDVKGGFANY